MPSVTVEFTGLSRSIAGVSEVELQLEPGMTYRDVIRQLGARYPGLVGILIAEDGETFLSSNMFIIDGNYANPAMVMEDSPRDGEHIHLMSVITGG